MNRCMRSAILSALRPLRAPVNMRVLSSIRMYRTTSVTSYAASSAPSGPTQAFATASSFESAGAPPSFIADQDSLGSGAASSGSESAVASRPFSDDAAAPLFEDLSRSFKGISAEPFPPHVAEILDQEINPDDIEVKPDGMLYMPEIKYRRILNKAFGPGGWGLVPRGPHSVNNKNISREYALFCLGRFVAQARGEQDFFGEDSLPTASEGCKSNALMRCCKDLGISWELWDPVFIRKFKAEHAVIVQGVHATTGAKKWLWRRKDRTLDYPYREDTAGSASGSGSGSGSSGAAPARSSASYRT
eukprot:jgi/Hompol1/3305/HPOL_006461-RA